MCTSKCYFYLIGIRVVTNAFKIAQELRLREDFSGSRDRLRQLSVVSGRMSFEVPVGRMAGNQPFQEPRYEILERYLDELRQV